jgi:hypothetical protein
MPRNDNVVNPSGGSHRSVAPYAGRHRDADESPNTKKRPWWSVLLHGRLHGRPLAVRLAAVALPAAIGIGSLCMALGGTGTAPAATPAVDLGAWPMDRQTGAASRSDHRAPVGPSATSTTPPANPKPPAKAKPRVRAKPPAKPRPSRTTRPRPTAAPKPTVPAPVGGLTTVQMGNAATIVSVGKQMQLPKQAYIVAIATAMQESQLLNLANSGSSESLGLPHDGVGGDHDSVGLFQQRPSAGWGTVAECMTPATAARRFYQALVQVAGWQSMPVTVAAQTVQGSAYPDAYAKWESLATLVVNALA